MILIYDINMGYNHSNHGLRKILYDIFPIGLLWGSMSRTTTVVFWVIFKMDIRKVMH